MLVKTVRILVALVLLLTIGVLPAPPIMADGTTSIRVVKYASDGVTVLGERTIDYTEMQTLLPVQGDGSTVYYHQGPTFDPGNLWDPDETVNLKIKGALRGTDLKDLCNLVGGMSAGDTVRVLAIDGFGKTFDYANVYSPSSRQGKIVVAWHSDLDGYVPTWEDGMLLAFFAETTNAAGQHVFGNEDMRQTLPENRWHYFDTYPSSNGFSIKNISQIAIYSSSDGTSTGRESTELNLSTNVVLPEVGIALSRDAADYGEVEPGEVSPLVQVDITNVGTRKVSVSLELLGDGEIAQEFYERSLYINGVAYAPDAEITTLEKEQTKKLDTQVKVPLDWQEAGRQNAVLVFWAEAVD